MRSVLHGCCCSMLSAFAVACLLWSDVSGQRLVSIFSGHCVAFAIQQILLLYFGLTNSSFALILSIQPLVTQKFYQYYHIVLTGWVFNIFKTTILAFSISCLNCNCALQNSPCVYWQAPALVDLMVSKYGVEALVKYLYQKQHIKWHISNCEYRSK